MFEEYETFELRIFNPTDNQYPVEVTRSPAGEAAGIMTLPFDRGELEETLLRFETFDTDRDFSKAFGAQLFRALFSEPILARYAESLAIIGDERGLRLSLRIDPPELATLPWETLYDETRQTFVANSPKTPLTRYLACPEPISTLQVEPPLRILVVMASPSGLEPLDTEQEKAAVTAALRELIADKKVQVEFLEKATMPQLVDRLREGFHVLHFVGHGDLDEDSGVGYLAFEDDWEGRHLIDGEALGQVLEDTSVRLVLLNACETAKVSEREARLGVAPALVNAGLPAVIAMQTEIPDETAAILSREFYKALVDNYPVDAALAEARKVILSEMGMENVDWAIPVLFMRAPDGRVLNLTPPKTWRETWLTPGRIGVAAIVLLALAAALAAAIPGARELGLLPTPVPTATPLALAPASGEEILVLVSQFRGDGSIDASRRIVNKVREDLARAAMVNARVEEFPELIEDAASAQAVGEVYSATLVIWGWYDDFGIAPTYKVIRRQELVETEVELGEVTSKPSQPDEFALFITEGLPQEMSYVSFFTLGQMHYFDGKYDEALSLFNRALDAVSAEERRSLGREYVYFYRGYIRQYIVGGQLEQAIADYDQAIKLEPDLAVAYNNRGNAYTDKGDHDRAVADYTQAIQLQPDTADVYSNRGAAFWKLGKYDQAIADCSRAIELNPQFALAYINRGNVRHSLGEYDQAIADYTQAIELDPTNTRAYSNRGAAHSNLGDYDQAIADCTQATELDPEFAEAYNNRGFAHSGLGEYNQAIADYTKAIEIVPESAVAYQNRGYAYTVIGEYERAITDYAQAIALDPEDAGAYFNRGRAHIYLGEYDKAIPDFTKAIELSPGLVWAHILRGAAYSASGEYDQAIADFDQAIRLQPDEVMAYYNRGEAHYNQGDYDRAVADYTQAIQLQPDFAEAYHNRGSTYYYQGEYDRAIADYTRAIELDPEYVDPYGSLAWLYADTLETNLQEAISLAEKAVALVGEDQPQLKATYMDTLGWAYYKAGQPEKALSVLEEALRLAPELEEIQEHLDVVRQAQ